MVVKLTAPILLAACLAGPALAQPATAAPRPTALIHGNYCGPGNNAPLPPIDALDAACARHDACTPDGGLPSKACNLRLQREAAAISRDPRQPDDVRAMAGLVSVGASLMLADQRSPALPGQEPTAVPAAVQSASGWPDEAADSVPADDDGE